jgi:hypothetical protein
VTVALLAGGAIIGYLALRQTGRQPAVASSAGPVSRPAAGDGAPAELSGAPAELSGARPGH